MNLKLLAFVLVVFGVTTRLIPHSPNVVPVTAISLFASTYLPKKLFFLPLVILLISDFIIGFYGTDMLYVYGSYLLIGVLGMKLRSRVKPTKLIGTTLFSSVLFFLITNFGVWAWPNNWYQHNFNGLMQSYVMGLPFFKNSLVADFSYTILLFGGYELVLRIAKKYLPQKLFSIAF